MFRQWIEEVLFGRTKIELVDPTPPACCGCVFWNRHGLGTLGECMAQFEKTNIHLSVDGRPIRAHMTTAADFFCKNFMVKV